MQSILKITKQTSWQLLSRFTSVISGIVILGIIARNYGKVGVGDFSLGLLFIIFFQTVVDFGVNAHIVKKLHDADNLLEWRKLLGARLLWGVFLVIAAALITILLPYSPPDFGFSRDFKIEVFLGLITVIFFAVKSTNLSLIQAKLKYQLDVLPVTLGSLACLLIIIYSAIQKVPIYYLIAGYIVSFFLQAVIPLIFNRTLFKSFKPIFDFGYAKNLLIETWPLSATLILNTIYFRVDVFIMSFFKGAADVGVYNIGYQFFQTALVLPTFIMNAVYPLLLTSIKENSKKFSGQLKISGWTLFFLSLVVTAFTIILAPFLVNIVAGRNFDGSIVSLQILSLGFPGFFLTSLLMWLIIIKNKYKQMFFVYLIGLVFNFVVNLVLIPQYSYIGAAWVTVISEYLILVLQVMVLWKKS